MIGHEILLSSGDSTSRVLPIEKEGKRYRIEFESEFKINPKELVAAIDSIVNKTRIADYYLVEVEECKTDKVVYSYEIGIKDDPNLIPCQSRKQEISCYSLLFTILDGEIVRASSSRYSNYFISNFYSYNYFYRRYFLVYFRKPKSDKNINSDVITIGTYHFDKKNMELSLGNQSVELTSKEADLLALLYSSANDTLKREDILKAVWGDEGDYVGRTLDVFISKLRKKLGEDDKVKIVNVRGVGYKLVVN
ncbi:MAG: response regulator transcription factor [Saprospiraceae bacterium]|nr:response regulator transcription factor [Saprospiraceae bacterium]